LSLAAIKKCQENTDERSINTPDNRLCGERCYRIGYVDGQHCLGLTTFINKGMRHSLCHGDRQIQTLATAWISVARRHNPINRKCPSPAVDCFRRKYLDRVAFVFETLHDN